ncbi:hypothetical protein ACQ5SK_04205 [Bradyrhizobium japonicum]
MRLVLVCGAGRFADRQRGLCDVEQIRSDRFQRRPPPPLLSPGPNAAGLAFMGVAAGLIGGAIAESRRQEYYENRDHDGPGPYYGGQGDHGGGP